MIRKYDYCIQCGMPIRSGRKDKKFCCIKCKNNYNNEHHDATFSLRLRTMNILNRNYRILSDAITANCTNAEIEDLVAIGFNPDYATFIKKAEPADEMKCFDIKYSQNSKYIYNIRNMVPLFSDTVKAERR